MANNITGGRKNGMIARTATALSSLFNTSNCTIVTQLNGVPVSWRPDRDINAITHTIPNVSYIVQALTDLDREANFYPPIPDGGSADTWAQKDW